MELSKVENCENIIFGDSLTFAYQVYREEKWHMIAAKKARSQMFNRSVSWGSPTQNMITMVDQSRAHRPPSEWRTG